MEIKENKPVVFENDDFIWRYIDLFKLFSFLFDKKLFFTRLDNFNDPLEGLTEKTLGYLGIIDGIPKSEKEMSSFTTEKKQKLLTKRENMVNYIKNETEKFQKTQFANCWFVGKKESFAMWNIYSDVNSVAIRYNPKELIDIVIPSAESYNHSDFKLLIYGFVDYDNIWPFIYFEKRKVKIIHTAFKKDTSYIHEKEFRFVVLTSPKHIGKYDKFELPLGDISHDNFKIFANPYMETWKFNDLKRLLKNFSMQDKLEKSKLNVKNK
jgi:hypothetical protein